MKITEYKRNQINPFLVLAVRRLLTEPLSWLTFFNSKTDLRTEGCFQHSTNELQQIHSHTHMCKIGLSSDNL
jgi:hypothetical protein